VRIVEGNEGNGNKSSQATPEMLKELHDCCLCLFERLEEENE